MPFFEKHITLNRWLLTIVLTAHSFFLMAQYNTDVSNFLPENHYSSENLVPDVAPDSTNIIINNCHSSDELNVDKQNNARDSLINENITFVVAHDIVYRNIGQFKTTDGKQAFTKAFLLKRELDKTIDEISRLRREFNLIIDHETKDSISERLLLLEINSIDLKSNVDLLLMQSREAETAYWNNAPMSEKESINIESLTLKTDSIPTTYADEPDTLFIEPFDEEYVINDIENETDLAPQVEIDHVNTVIYKVQIGAYSRGLPDYVDRLYKRLSVLRRIDTYTNERGVTVYTVGELSNFDDAVRLQNQVRQEGVTDAFVVAFLNGKRITIKEAREKSER